MMKRLIPWFILIAILFSCGREEAPSTRGAGTKTPGVKEEESLPRAPSSSWKGGGPNPRFYKVAEKLERNGDLYLYTDIKDNIRSAKEELLPLLENPGMPPESKQIFQAGLAAIEAMGMEGVESMGVSGVRDNDLFRTRMFLLSPGEKTGIFDALGTSPISPVTLSHAPGDAAAFILQEIHPTQMLKLVREIASKTGEGKMARQLEQGMARMEEELGVKLELLLESLGHEFAFMLDLDETEKWTISYGEGENYSFPTPRFAFLIPVKSTLLMDTMENYFKNKKIPVETVDEGNVKRLLLPEKSQGSYTMEPVLLQDGSYVIYASHNIYADEILSTKKGGPSLDTAGDFQKLTRGFSRELNGMAYISPRLGKELGGFLKHVMNRSVRESGFDPTPLMDFIAPFLGGMASFRISDPEGFLVVSHRAIAESEAPMLEPLALLTTTGIAPLAVMGAIAVPNFLEAQSRSKVSRVKADLRSLATAIEAYNVDNNSYPMWASGEKGANARVGAGQSAFSIPSFRIWSKVEERGRFHLLSTPIAYITGIFEDPFAAEDGAVYGYYSIGDKGWILYSTGPDKVYDIIPGEVLDSGGEISRDLLIGKTYDPTNGTVSAGDIYRTRD